MLLLDYNNMFSAYEVGYLSIFLDAWNGPQCIVDVGGGRVYLQERIIMYNVHADHLPNDA